VSAREKELAELEEACEAEEQEECTDSLFSVLDRETGEKAYCGVSECVLEKAIR
jgi:hypothetical protein